MIEAFLSQHFAEASHRNTAVALLTVVYVKAVVGCCDLAVSAGVLPPKVSRKMIHVAAGSWIVFWPYFDPGHWTWKLNVLVPAVYTVQLFVKGAIVKDPSDSDVKTMTRTGSPAELLNGPIFFTVLMTLVGLNLYMTKAGVVIMACLGYGDGLAPLVGTYFPCGTHYPTFPFGPNDKKTLTGSLGFVVSAVLGFHLLKAVVLKGDNGGDAENDDENGDSKMITAVAVIAAITEGLCGAYDNPCVALAAFLSYKYYHLIS